MQRSQHPNLKKKLERGRNSCHVTPLNQPLYRAKKELNVHLKNILLCTYMKIKY